MIGRKRQTEFTGFWKSLAPPARPPPKIQADDPLFYAWVDDATTFYKMFGKRDFYIDTVQEIPMSCYMAPTFLK